MAKLQVGESGRKLDVDVAQRPIARALAVHFARDGAALYLAARDIDEARRIAEDVNVRTGVNED